MGQCWLGSGTAGPRRVPGQSCSHGGIYGWAGGAGLGLARVVIGCHSVPPVVDGSIIFNVKGTDIQHLVCGKVTQRQHRVSQVPAPHTLGGGPWGWTQGSGPGGGP